MPVLRFRRAQPCAAPRPGAKGLGTQPIKNVGFHRIPRAPAKAIVTGVDRRDESACFLAEWYLPEFTQQSVDDIVARLDAAAATATDGGTPVQLLVTLAVPEDEVLYGVFGADSPEAVSRTCLAAGAPHQRLSARVGTRIRQRHG